MKKILFLSLAIMGFGMIGFANNTPKECQIVCQQSDYDYLMNKIIEFKNDAKNIEKADIPSYVERIKAIKEEIENSFEKNTLTEEQKEKIKSEFNDAIEMLKKVNAE